MSNSKTNSIILGGGCFWCLEAAYQQIKGVESVISGYAGGETKNPTYQEVSTGSTGHAEVVKVVFDPTVISIERILEIFFTIHNPTTLNRQGADIGTQYRSIILFNDKGQHAIAQNVIESLNKEAWDNNIVTEVKPLETFFKAEEYHQNYFRNNPSKAYCQAIINPKLQKLQDVFQSHIKDDE